MAGGRKVQGAVTALEGTEDVTVIGAPNTGKSISLQKAIVTITLPASPSAGDEVHVLDATASFDSNNLTIGRNSKKIQGADADLTITTQNTGIGLVFYNDTYGWRVLVDAYDVDVTEL